MQQPALVENRDGVDFIDLERVRSLAARVAGDRPAADRRYTIVQGQGIVEPKKTKAP